MVDVPSSVFHRAKSGDHCINLCANLFFLFKQCSTLTAQVVQLPAQSLVFLAKSFTQSEQFVDLLFQAVHVICGVVHGGDIVVVPVD
jgi:hypothetical protein